MKKEELLEKRIAYEKMLAELSELAVRVEDMDAFVQRALERMGTILRVSRVFMFIHNSPGGTFTCRCGWDEPALALHRGTRNIVLDMPDAARELRAGRTLNYPDTDKMPFRNYRAHLLAENVKSTLNVPLFVHGEMYGFIGFDEHRKHRRWHDSDLYILTTAAQILSRTIENKLYERELLENKNLLESIFSSVQDAIITVDKDLRIITVNMAAPRICHTDMKPGQAFDACTDRCSRACLPLLREVLTSRRPVRESQISCLRNGSREEVSTVTCSPLHNGAGEFMGAVLVIRDISRVAFLESVLRERSNYQGIIGQSEPMQRIYDLLQTLADMDTTVLITGESGTGKERVAHALHYGGRRAAGPFIRVNCSALAENLLESELFGHARGAFTGADKESKGRFEAAHGGSILLDEIGDISPRIQLKLLRVLEEKEIERVGETVPRKVDVRVLAATNRDLREAIRKGAFREDLWYRLNVMPLHLPPLRERLEDLPLLVEHFLAKFNEHYGKGIQTVSPLVMEAFMRHPWTGNVRELGHVIERAFVLCKGAQILPEHILLREPWSAEKKEGALEDERQRLCAVLEHTAWNVSRAARQLGISRWTLYRRMLRFGIERERQGM